MSAAAPLPNAFGQEQPLLACTISRDVHRFDLLIEDMETLVTGRWGDLTFSEARGYLEQAEAAELDFIAIAIDADDEGDIGLIGAIIRSAAHIDVPVILIAENVSPQALHQFLKLGADDFLPYPLPEHGLREAVARALGPKPAEPPAAPLRLVPEQLVQTGRRLSGQGSVFAVQGLAGGVGSSAFAVNLAWEMANIDREVKGAKAPSVCLLDFDLQNGSIATYLDLPRRDQVVEVLSDAQSMDREGLQLALTSFRDRMAVFTAPSDIVPLDLVGPAEIGGLIDLAVQNFDLVVIDMPTSFTHWTEAVLTRADIYFALLELDLRSAQNAMRLVRLLRAEDLPMDRVHFTLNRAPGLTDMAAKGRVKRLAESLSVSIQTLLPDAGKALSQACDEGVPLGEFARKNPLRREIARLAATLHKSMDQAASGG